jgi:hypothetical protein
MVLDGAKKVGSLSLEFFCQLKQLVICDLFLRNIGIQVIFCRFEIFDFLVDFFNLLICADDDFFKAYDLFYNIALLGWQVKALFLKLILLY